MGEWLNLRQLIFDALEGLGVPVCYMAWVPMSDEESVPDTYITYQEPLAQDALKADDAAWNRGRYWQVDIWSVDPTEQLADRVRAALEGIGCISRGELDVPESTNTFHRTTRWVYFEEVKHT